MSAEKLEPGMAVCTSDLGRRQPSGWTWRDVAVLLAGLYGPAIIGPRLTPPEKE